MTTWVSRHQNVKLFCILLQQEMMEVAVTTGPASSNQIIDINILAPSFYTSDALPVAQQQCQSTEGI